MSKEAMKLALEALEGIHPGNMTPMAEEYWNKAITALREALAAQPAQQEPVVRWDSDGWGDLLVDSLPDGTLLYTSPPAQRTWVSLTDEQIWKFWWSRPEVPDGEDDSMEAEFVAAVRRVLAAHGLKENT